MTGNRDDAWDLFQETVLRVAPRWDRLRDQQPGAYASTVMARLNVDRFRRIRRELLSAVRIGTQERRDVPVVVDEGDAGLDRDLVAAMETLTPNQRTAVVLRYVLDLDTADIADRMHCSAATVRTHLSRGLDRLRRASASTHQTYQGVGHDE